MAKYSMYSMFPSFRPMHLPWGSRSPTLFHPFSEIPLSPSRLAERIGFVERHQSPAAAQPLIG